MKDIQHDWLTEEGRRRAWVEVERSLAEFDADEELTMQNYIEARGWFYDGGNRWVKCFTGRLEITDLVGAYEQELSEETEGFRCGLTNAATENIGT